GPPRGRAARLPAQRPRPLLLLQGRAVRGPRPPGRCRGPGPGRGDQHRRPGRPPAGAAGGGRGARAPAHPRPGQRAAPGHGVLPPLAPAGFSKAEARRASRRMGLRTADKPAAACLASRVAYGVQVTPARLSRGERAEALLRSFGLAQLRVRDHGDLARVEVPIEALGTLVQPDRRARLVAGLRELGFSWVTLDLEGFRSGSMNAGLDRRAAPCGAWG